MDFFRSRTGIIILSIIWGLGLSTLFRKSCDFGESCKVIEYRGPPSSLNNKIWNYGDPTKCYKLNPEIVKCPKDSLKVNK
jgi:hypothetical protein